MPPGWSEIHESARPPPAERAGAEMPGALSGRRLRETRHRAGLAQAELARRAGVSRGTVSAIEHGRHVPAVDAALRLAGVLGVTVEQLFGADTAFAPVAVLDDRLSDGALVRAGRVDEQVVLGSVFSNDATGWGVADGIIDAGALRLFAEGSIAGALVLGCDPALAIVDQLSARRGAERVIGVSATSGQALRALHAGRCHAALVHGRSGHLPAPPVPVARWHLARWRVGIGVHRELGSPSLESLLGGETALVRHHATAASDQAVERAARRLGLPGASDGGPVATGHLDAAHRAAWMHAAAVTFEPAAGEYDLHFEALETHVVQLWVAEPWRAHPGITTLLDIIASRAFTERVSAHDGYDLHGSATQPTDA